MGVHGHVEASRWGAVTVSNPAGAGRVVVVVDHASNAVPDAFSALGLDHADMQRHIAWDPGALPVARRLAEALDAPLIASNVSRLVIDCNRAADAHDLVPTLSETTAIPGNADLDAAERLRRLALAHGPFHAAIDAILDHRQRAGLETWLVSVHSFTPVYRGVPRPWELGILHDDDERLSAAMLDAFREIGGLTVGDNQPYSPSDGVYFTLARHGRARGLPCAMIEIRNDEIATEEGQTLWAGRLASVLAEVRPDWDRLEKAP